MKSILILSSVLFASLAALFCGLHTYPKFFYQFYGVLEGYWNQGILKFALLTQLHYSSTESKDTKKITNNICKSSRSTVRQAALTGVANIARTESRHLQSQDLQAGSVGQLLVLAKERLDNEDANCIFGIILVLLLSRVEINHYIADHKLGTLMDACAINADNTNDSNNIAAVCIASLSKIIEVTGWQIMDKIVAEPAVFISFIMSILPRKHLADDNTTETCNNCIYALRFLTLLAWYNDQAAIALFGSPLVMSRLTTLATKTSNEGDEDNKSSNLSIHNTATLCLQVIKRKVLRQIDVDNNESLPVQEHLQPPSVETNQLPLQHEVELYYQEKEGNNDQVTSYSSYIAAVLLAEELSSLLPTTVEESASIVKHLHDHELQQESPNTREGDGNALPEVHSRESSSLDDNFAAVTLDDALEQNEALSTIIDSEKIGVDTREVVVSVPVAIHSNDLSVTRDADILSSSESLVTTVHVPLSSEPSSVETVQEEYLADSDAIHEEDVSPQDSQQSDVDRDTPMIAESSSSNNVVDSQLEDETVSVGIDTILPEDHQFESKLAAMQDVDTSYESIDEAIAEVLTENDSRADTEPDHESSAEQRVYIDTNGVDLVINSQPTDPISSEKTVTVVESVLAPETDNREDKAMVVEDISQMQEGDDNNNVVVIVDNA